MKISVVTISFNQAKYLQACIDSVTRQQGDWEHIIVDPGSTDGSREIIEANRHHFSKIILEPDQGPSDGLNKGFAVATGDIYYYLNSDDIVMPRAFSKAVDFLVQHPNVDVASGHGYVIDEKGCAFRKVWSSSVSRIGLAHGGSILIQPATFIRRRAFEMTKGFNVDNRSNWDGELVLEMFLAGARFAVVEDYWAGYRIHGDSLTGTARLDARIREWGQQNYRMLMGRDPRWEHRFIVIWFRFAKLVRRPEALIFRMRGQKVYGGRS